MIEVNKTKLLSDINLYRNTISKNKGCKNARWYLVAQNMGVDVTVLYGLRKLKNPSVLTMYRLCKAIGKTVDEYISDSDRKVVEEKPEDYPTLAELVNTYRRDPSPNPKRLYGYRLTESSAKTSWIHADELAVLGIPIAK